MIYYMIRHKETQEFMPQLKRGRGYTHWNPSKKNTVEHLGHKLTGTPRLFAFRRSAARAIIQWNSMPNARWQGYTTAFGENDYDIDFKSDDRKKEDLEVVEVDIIEVKI